jgi:hypothetical protein
MWGIRGGKAFVKLSVGNYTEEVWRLLHRGSAEIVTLRAQREERCTEEARRWLH